MREPRAREAWPSQPSRVQIRSLVDLPALAEAAGDPALAQQNLGLADTRSGTGRRRHDFALAVHISEQNRV